jgi:hypothetical protein
MTPGATSAQRNWGARIREYTYFGMQLIVLENELLRVGVLAGKGADIVELTYKPRDLDFTWLAPGGVRSPADLGSPYRDPLATFVETYPGGWQEIFPNGGAPSTLNGVQFGQHDEVFALPWSVEVVDDTPAAIGVRFTTRTHKVPCVLERTMRMDAKSPKVRIEERLVNSAAVPVRAMWGHHITFGPPFLRAGFRIELPQGVTGTPHHAAIEPGGRRVAGDGSFSWPHARSQAGDTVDLSVVPDRGAPSDIVYLSGFPDDRGHYEIIDPERAIGSRVEWDARQMPYLWYWQEFGATIGYPWYGQLYTVGLEPFSSYPTDGLERAVRNGTALTLEPGNPRDFWLNMTILDGERGGV